MRLFVLSAFVALAGLSVVNWRVQLRTQNKLDALTAALAERPPVPLTVPTPAPTAPPVVASAQQTEAPRELKRVLPPYIIETPDQLTIEVVLKDPKTGTATRLPTQPISGQFIVRPDGTVGLGFWGSVFVSGFTVDEAGQRIRDHLARAHHTELAVEQLVVVVDVLAYNSKFYYVITDSAENGGEQASRYPITGSETVLDALAKVPPMPSKMSIASVQVRRKKDDGNDQILLVEAVGPAQQIVPATNYQLLPGDRVMVKTRARD